MYLPKTENCMKYDEDVLECTMPEKLARTGLMNPLEEMISHSKDVLSNLGATRPKKAEVSEADLYEDNGGTTITIKVDNKLIIAADTRLNSDYNIYTRKSTKIHRIGDFFLTTAGFFADGYSIATRLNYALKQYEQYDTISLSSMAQLLHHVLYNNRFFPLYSYCCLSGFETINGVKQAMLYSYDCVGSYQSVACRVDGTGTKMIQPLLDSWIDGKNFENYQGIKFDDALNLIKKAFDSAAESDIKTGDHLEVVVVDERGPRNELIDLRKD
ncbi:PSB6 [Enterospora canceri]|uniref:PSB6 n=1 Tax=Enterospora canceri TaxID=1081671 RepID=A0A1Y1S5I3_9MICR|nr:PSB6 [Enterospora canceri]